MSQAIEPPEIARRKNERALVKPAGMMLSTKVAKIHSDRLALVYVRQSTQQQVLEHKESTARQYALVDRAIELGWPRDRIEVIDEDQGQSGSSSTNRTGFQRLLGQVSGDVVGLVLGLEMSRLARSCKDWYALLELCSIYQTLLADADGIYDPTNHNDRLLLGLKGTMSEVELHVLKSRMYRGLCNKAERGEVLNHPPIGFVRTAAGDFEIDPDEQVQSIVRTIFERFAKWKSISTLLKSLVRDELKIPVRPHFGIDRGQIQWRRPNRVTLLNLLHHPIYAGAYRWGHREIDPKRKIPGRRTTGRTLRSHTTCRVLIHDRFDAYITWDKFEENQRVLTENSRKSRFLASPGRGASLLAGLLQCGRCGRSMTVGYSCERLRYCCQRGVLDYGEMPCQSLSGNELDQTVARLILEAVRPASVELSLSAAKDIAKQRKEACTQWEHRLRRIAYEVALASRQYNAVDPDNRLVANELERRWEGKLKEQQQLELSFQQYEQSQARELTREELAAIQSLSRDMELLWNSPRTNNQDRQFIARALIERVVVTVEDKSERVDVEVRWAGGFVSRLTHSRPVQAYDQLSHGQELHRRAEQLKNERFTLASIAAQLNREGYRPVKRAKEFNSAIVSKLLRRERERTGRQTPAPRDRRYLKPDEWWLTDLAVKLRMPIATLHRWRRVGWVGGRKVEATGGHWALYADRSELKRLKRLREYRRSWDERKTPAELTTPCTPKRR